MKVRNALSSLTMAYVLQDPAPAVRQQAVDLLGSNIGMNAALAQEYFDIVVNASNDTSTSVRKVTGPAPAVWYQRMSAAPCSLIHVAAANSLSLFPPVPCHTLYSRAWHTD